MIFYPTLSRASPEGFPENFCRYGSFVNDWPNYKLAKITAQKSYFIDDDSIRSMSSATKIPCPENEACKTKSYVIKDDVILTAYKYQNFICSWYPGKESPKWLPLKDVEASPFNPTPTINDWVGKWTEGKDINITLSRTSNPGGLKIHAKACCIGYGMHVGEIEATSKTNGNKIIFRDEIMDCTISLMLINQVIIAKDNNQCGGESVTFSGLYKKRTKSNLSTKENALKPIP